MSTHKRENSQRPDGHGDHQPNKPEKPDLKKMEQDLKAMVESVRKIYVVVLENDINFARERGWESTGTLEGCLEKMKTIKTTDIADIRKITTEYFLQCKKELERELQDLKGLPSAERKAKEEKYQFAAKLKCIKTNLQLNSTGDAIKSVGDSILSALDEVINSKT